MIVTRVYELDGSSHIEPPLDPTSTDWDALQWKAAVVAYDTGMPVKIRTANLSTNGVKVPDAYQVQVFRSTCTEVGFNATWALLNGIMLGVEAQFALKNAAAYAASKVLAPSAFKIDDSATS